MCFVASAVCHTCGHTDEITVDAHAVEEWLSDPHSLVQHAFPQLSIDEAEILIGYRSGFYLCGNCWDFRNDEE